MAQPDTKPTSGGCSAPQSLMKTTYTQNWSGISSTNPYTPVKDEYPNV